MITYNQPTPFLRQIAQYYVNHEDLSQYCFVFPNRRGGTFFLKELSEATDNITIMPKVTTVTQFLTELTGSVAVSPVESLFILYDCYRRMIDSDMEFDRFIFWGAVVLNDFNDVDKYLVDTDKLFSNVVNYKEIASNYISGELKEQLSRFFNISNIGTDDERFWLHVNKNNESEFVNKSQALWSRIGELYNAFNNRLAELGLAGEGQIYRKAVKLATDMAPDEFRHKRYIFVGFNFISTCEKKIFKALSKKRMADFFWDDASPSLQDEQNVGRIAVKANKSMFPQPDDFIPEEIVSEPKVEVVSVPSTTGQARYINQLLTDTHLKDEIERSNLNGGVSDTAIVLPDEGLLIPVVNAIPDYVKEINITMGYSIRNSDIMSLMRSCAKMHSHAMKNDSGWYYYREFVKDLLSHPLLKSSFTDDVTRLISKINDDHIINVPENTTEDLPFHCLFKVISQSEGYESTLRYIDNLRDFVEYLSTGIKKNNGYINADGEAEGVLPLQCAFLDSYVDILDMLYSTICKYKIKMNELSLFNLINRLAYVISVPFEGEPVRGLQIMGILETRSLDFKNIILLSVNERVYPQRNGRTPSFIPTPLRIAFEMPTSSDREVMSTYYFYRMISRAERVWLIYDSSAKKYGTAEESRFVRQLEIRNKNKNEEEQVKFTQVSVVPSIASDVDISVPNAGYVLPYFDTNNDITLATDRKSPQLKGVKIFSASSINQYVNCSLQFFLHHIKHLNDETDKGDFMDAGTFGSIIHATLQDLYDTRGRQSNRFTISDIKNFKQYKLDKTLTRNINKIYLHRRDDKIDMPITGEPLILFDVMRYYVNTALNFDIETLQENGGENACVEILECEKLHYCHLKLGDIAINFQYLADRIDRIHGTNGISPVRIIDYKTGDDDTAFKEINDLFDNQKTNRRKAILQLFLYSNAYFQSHPECDEIMPIIYSLKDKEKCGVKIGGNQITLQRYCKLNNDFLDRINQLLHNMKTADFVQCNYPKVTHCDYCRFIDICHR